MDRGASMEDTSSRNNKVDPLWSKEWAPLSQSENYGLQWLSFLPKVAPPSDAQKAQPAFLPAFLCHNLALNSSRSQAGHLFFTLPVTPGITNRYSTLHGGVIGSLVEILGCAAISSATKSSDGFVSDINISYISGTPVKDEVELEARVLRAGKNIAVALVDVRNKKTGKSAAQGRVTMCFDPVSRL